MTFGDLLRPSTGLIISLYFVYKCIAAENLALGKKCLQSSIKDGRDAWLATDGQKIQNFALCQNLCCTHTQHEVGAWWTVDLGDVYEITNVIIFGRTDCCRDRLSKFYIEAIKPYNSRVCSAYSPGNWSNFDQGEVTEIHFEESAIAYLNVPCKTGTVGQFLRIRLEGQNILTICEVEVYGNQARPLFLGSKTETKCGVAESYYQGKVLVKTHSRSIIECTVMCSFRDGCFAANFKAVRKECDLMEKLPGEYSQYMVTDSAWSVHFNP